jgi:RES domain-containing protein
MAAFFRIVQTQWAASAMTGEGARLYGGRWNPQGLPAVYLAESRALAALEILVHAPREVLHLDWTIIEVEVPDDRIEPVDPEMIPTDWRGTLLVVESVPSGFHADACQTSPKLPLRLAARHFGSLNFAN